jgi:hypothetical protein
VIFYANRMVVTSFISEHGDPLPGWEITEVFCGTNGLPMVYSGSFSGALEWVD